MRTLRPLFVVAAGAASVFPLHTALGQDSTPVDPDAFHVVPRSGDHTLRDHDMRRSRNIGAIDGLIGGAGTVDARGATRSHDPTLGNPNPWASLIGPDDFHEGFEHYTPHTSLASSADWFELAGQTAPNGNVWQASADYNGVVNNAIAQTGPNWNPGGTGFDRQGVVGGPDPTEARSQVVASPRGTIEPQPEVEGTLFIARLRHDYFAPTLDTPVATVIDYYLDDITTFTWFRPVSNVEGGIVTNLFMGGYDFQYFCPFFGDCTTPSDRIVMLGAKVGGENEGEYFVAPEPHRIAERAWYQIAIRQTVDSFSIWVRDASTIGVNGFAQDSAYDAFPGDPTRGAFAGEIFAQDWLQVFPGVEDDPGTPVIEGAGGALNLNFQPAEMFLDASGSPAGRRLFCIGVDGLQIIGGSDPNQNLVPGFQPHDWYVDNYTVLGEPFTLPSPAPECVPFFDDMEQWTPGPMSLQSNVWFGADGSSMATDANHTPGGVQSARFSVPFASGLMGEAFRRRTPRADPTSTEPLSVRMQVILDGPASTRGVFADDNTISNDWAFRLLMGARNGAGVVDDRFYARVPNPNFDPNQLEAIDEGVADQHVNGRNTRFVNVPLVDGGLQVVPVPQNQWFEVVIEVAAPYDEPESLRVFIDGVEVFAEGSVEGVTSLSSPSGVFDELEFWSGNELAGSTIWVDDLEVIGPPYLEPTPLTVGDAPFSNHPPFLLPYVDDLAAYQQDRPLGGQGVTPWLATLFYEPLTQLVIIPLGAGESVDTTTEGYYYTIDSVVSGALPGGVGASNTVFVVDNIAPYQPPSPNPAPGSTSTPRQAAFQNEDCATLGIADLVLTAATPSVWDGATPVMGRYLFTYRPRFTGAIAQESALYDAVQFPLREQVAALRSTVADGFATLGGLDPHLFALLPEARPVAGEAALLEFDLYIAIDDPLVGPRGRLAWTLRGPGAQGGEIATVVFGGPHNYLDVNTIDTSTGAVTPGADGLPDNYFRGQPESLGGAPTYADPTRMYVRVPNPNGGFGVPQFMLEQTAYTVPGNTWLRCSAEIEPDGAWTMTFDDGVSAPLVLAGDALDAGGGDVAGTSSLELWNGFDPGAGAEPTRGVITWQDLGAAAAPEGGVAPLPAGANTNPNGSLNEVSNPTYLYFEILEIWAGSANMPLVTAIDPATGVTMGTAAAAQGDVVVLWNDQSTAAFGGPSGTPFIDRIAKNTEFRVSPDGGATITARGTWIPLGLPGYDGFNDPAPAGGVANLAPPYNDQIPYATMLMGSIADFPAFGPATPAAAWYVDNIFLDISGCLGDLSGDGVIDGADLGLLLGDWGDPDSPADLNGSGGVDGADLGLLLGLWGPCQ
ncbi:MAG: hypothetical protein ACF8QF_07325 [Phycisphaerales bacterium]